MGLFTDGFKLLKKASEPLYKTPKSIQETIEIMAVAENGIFEVSKNKYSKCYRFQDMQLYLQKAALEEMGIYHFDSWAANFGEVTTALELTVEGSGFRFKSRFNKFTNLPELMNIFREVADVQTADIR